MQPFFVRKAGIQTEIGAEAGVIIGATGAS